MYGKHSGTRNYRYTIFVENNPTLYLSHCPVTCVPQVQGNKMTESMGKVLLKKVGISTVTFKALKERPKRLQSILDIRKSLTPLLET